MSGILFVVFSHRGFIMEKAKFKEGNQQRSYLRPTLGGKAVKARQNATSHLHLEPASVTNVGLTSEVHSSTLGLFQ